MNTGLPWQVEWENTCIDFDMWKTCLLQMSFILIMLINPL